MTDWLSKLRTTAGKVNRGMYPVWDVATARLICDVLDAATKVRAYSITGHQDLCGEWSSDLARLNARVDAIRAHLEK